MVVTPGGTENALLILAFYTKDYDAECARGRLKSRRCAALAHWWDRIKQELTAYWVRIGEYAFTHVELMFSDESVVSATELGGVHYDQDRKLSNDGYTDFLAVEVSYTSQVLMQNFVAQRVGVPFNSAGRAWNSVACLRECFGTVDTEDRSYYCSELITTLLKMDNLCNPLDPRCTNPTQLYVYLQRSGEGRPYYNAKETRLSVPDLQRQPGERFKRILVGALDEKNK